MWGLISNILGVIIKTYLTLLCILTLFCCISLQMGCILVHFLAEPQHPCVKTIYFWFTIHYNITQRLAIAVHHYTNYINLHCNITLWQYFSGIPQSEVPRTAHYLQCQLSFYTVFLADTQSDDVQPDLRPVWHRLGWGDTQRSRECVGTCWAEVDSSSGCTRPGTAFIIRLFTGAGGFCFQNCLSVCVSVQTIKAQ